MFRRKKVTIMSNEDNTETSTEDLEAQLLSEIENLKKEPPSAEEMTRVITRYRADVLRGLRSNLGLAQELAALVRAGVLDKERGGDGVRGAVYPARWVGRIMPAVA